MYIHLLQIDELPDNIYKIILTNETIDDVIKYNEIFYNIKNVHTYEIDDIRLDVFNHFMELMTLYQNRHKHFILINNLNKFEKLVQNMDDLNDLLEGITNDDPLKLSKKESKRIFEILKFFIKESDKQHLFINLESLNNLKEFDEDKHKLYLDDNSTIHCYNDDFDVNDDKLYYVTIIDEQIYISSNPEQYIQIDSDERYKKPAELIEKMIDTSEIKKKSTNISDLKPDGFPCEILSSDIRSLNDTKDIFQKIADQTVKFNVSDDELYPGFDDKDYNEESIISKHIDFYRDDAKPKSFEELIKQRDEELEKPTSIKHYDNNDQYIDCASGSKYSSLFDAYGIHNELEKEEEINDDEDDKEENIILFVKNNVLEKNKIIYNKNDMEKIKKCKYLYEIEIIAEYVVPEINAVKELLEIKLKNIDNLTYDVIEKNIIKINEFLYGDDVIQSKRIINTNDSKSTLMLVLVRDFLVKNCVRKKGSKIYSNNLFNKFCEFLMVTSPPNIVYFNKNNFTPLVKKLNYKNKRDSNGIYWIDIDYQHKMMNKEVYEKFTGNWYLI